MSNVKKPRVFRLSDVIEEFKRLQVEHGNLPYVKVAADGNSLPAWPEIGKDSDGNKAIVVN